MPWFRWQLGRQGGGYEKMVLFASRRLRMDCYLLRFHQGSSVPWHTDPVEGGRHYRLNVTILRCKAGGIVLPKGAFFHHRRFMFFRPDITPHCMTMVRRGRTLMLSIGKVL